MNYAVILAGGVGSRFWPFSRELEPKQFMRLVGEESLLQSTIRRLKGIVAPKNTFIITNALYFHELSDQLKGYGIPAENIILEPEGKNTAPAIGLSAQLISKLDQEATLIVLPADHYIKNLAGFRKTIKKAIQAAQKEALVTIGIKPDKPSTAYGYIKIKSKVKKSLPAGRQEKSKVYPVDRFLEKPALDKAKKYFNDKNYFWNSGMFVWKANVFLKEVQKYLPGLFRQIDSIRSPDDIKKVWPKVKSISVDYGIMEHSRRIALIPADFYWTDLGSWDALTEVYPKDAGGNILQADTCNLDSRGIHIFSKANRLISAIGVRDLIIADTPDALLVCDRKKAQEVKRVVEILKSSNRKEHLAHFAEKRPWGRFTVLQESCGFKIKLIEIAAGRRLSLQSHKKRAEHWVVVAGKARVTSGKQTKLVKNDESIYIPRGIRHRLENPWNVPLKIVEVQTGAYLGEDDIERFEDDFNR
ncbi:MAG: mannose-1-phosphate guanylyltransferase/mannose-6-phosphate isomerase [Candidatus Omnitrophota bacterium]